MRWLINIYLIFLVILPNTLYADQVPITMAEKVANNFYFEKSDYTINQYSAISISDRFIYKENSQTVAYIFSIQPSGFVIVSADDICYPIIGYSLEQVVKPSKFPPAFKAWMAGISEQLLFAKNNNIKPTKRIQEIWANYLNYNHEDKYYLIPKSGIEPLLQSKWGQTYEYNKLCPVDTTTPSGHAPAGCVAVAMAQVMFYFRYPETGIGEHSYYDNNYGTISANFGETTYQWDEMVNAIFKQSNSAVAELIFHAGVSIETNYGSGGSSSLTSKTEDALKDFFNYHDDLEYRAWYDFQDSFKDSVIANLDRNLPMIYRGGGLTSSHSFVCDGYQDTSYFHFNWGWNGGYNGYYFVDNLNPGGYDFTFNQAAVMNIFPKENYPVFCSGLDTLKTTRGTFTDGSGPNNYNSNTNCSWLILPDDPDIEHIQLWFTSFNTEENNDIVSVYEGNTTNDPLIATFSGENLPPRITIDGQKVLVVFETDVETNLSGWQAEFLAYNETFCIPLDLRNVLNLPWFTDGSGPYHYVDNTYCEWLIQPQNEIYDSIASIRVHFHMFDLSEGDTLYFFENNLPQTHPFKKLSGSDFPDTVVCESNTLLMRLVADDSITGDGWAAGYTTVFPIYCGDTTILTEPNGSINDGSESKMYSPNAVCYWLLEQENVEAFLLTFTEFDLEYGYDKLQIIDYSENTNNIIETFSGHDIPPPLTVESNRILLAFSTDYAIQHGGWELDYQALAPGVDKNTLPTNLNIFPNPADEFITISYLTSEETIVDIKITDITSIEIYSVKTMVSPGEPKITLDIDELESGIYLLHYSTEKIRFTRKILIH